MIYTYLHLFVTQCTCDMITKYVRHTNAKNLWDVMKKILKSSQVASHPLFIPPFSA
jgi:hypothetical protein